jgi:dihydrofolate reductase
MRQIEWLVHISLDGFVAGKDGELDGFDANEENLEFVCDLTEKADSAILGRKSFQLLERFWPTAKDRQGATKNEIRYSNWYNSARLIVASNSIESYGRVTAIHGNIVDKIRRIKRTDGKNLLLFGSPSVARVLTDADLIDNFRIFVNPVIFGDGIPLFNGIVGKKRLKLMETRQFINGEVAFKYVLRAE